ncbi:MAG: primosomal protein N', partial [Patescibacteria group bacterium]
PAIAEWQFKIALWIAQYYVAPLGLCMKAVLPPFFLKLRYPITTTSSVKPELTRPPASWIIARAKNSGKHILSLLKSGNAGQTLILVPDTSYISYFKSELSSLKSAVITSATSNKEYYEIWNQVAEDKIQVVVGTRQALFLPFINLKRIVVIDPLHEFYKSDLSPKYWTPELAQVIASQYNARLISISPLLGVAAYHKLSNEEIQSSNSMRPWSSKLLTIDLSAEFKQGYVGIFSAQAQESIKRGLENKNKILIVSSRRGYSGILLCQKCGFSFKCTDCNIPMRIHQGTSLYLACHRCGKTQNYPNSCPNCHSSQIKATGPAGSQKIFEQLQKMMAYDQIPKAPILIMDSDITQNQTEEDEVVSEIKKSGPSILIATQKVFSYGYDLKFDTIIIPRLDALLFGSDFQTTERLWYQMEKLADFEPSNFIVQTFHQKELVLKLAQHEYDDLYEDELNTRKAFWYPPFCRLVKLTYSHKNSSKVVTSARSLIEKLKMASAHIQAKDKIKITESSPLFMKKEKGQFTYTIIVKIAPDFIPRELLKYVPSPWLIDLDPRSTL